MRSFNKDALHRRNDDVFDGPDRIVGLFAEKTDKVEERDASQRPSRELKRMTKARPQLLHPRMLLDMVLALHMRVGSVRKVWHSSALPSTPRACSSLFTAP